MSATTDSMKVFSAINTAAGQKMILDAINTQTPIDHQALSDLLNWAISAKGETSTFVTQGQVVMNLGAPDRGIR